MLISVDFDGTIVEHKFPEIGEPLEGAIETLKDLTAAGFRLILCTCREDNKRRKYLTEAVEFLKDLGVEFVSVNENTFDDDFRADYKGLRRKVYAHCYIDDCNLGGFPGWDVVREKLGLPPLTRPCSEELREPNLGPSTAEPLGETPWSGCEGHPGCLGAI